MMEKNSTTSSITSTLKMNDIKIVRLNSGEDIIAEYTLDKKGKNVLLNNPMHIIFKRTPSGSIMMILPWLPVELLKENVALIEAKNILTIAEPKDDLITYYHKLLEQAKETLLNQPDILSQFEEIEEDDDYETEPEIVDKKVNTIH
jgi:hypothetical protein